MFLKGTILVCDNTISFLNDIDDLNLLHVTARYMCNLFKPQSILLDFSK
jgi:hypothetical protein